MQPVEAHKGVSTKSQLFNSLKVYLNNKNRLQPIIGLCSIIECVRAGTHSRETLYLCEVCVCRLSKADIRNHIMGSLHRYNYIKTYHPHLVTEWKENADLSNLAWPLMEKAKILEGNEGPGEVQMLEVEDAIYQRMATLSENEAVNLINVLRDEPCSHSETTSMQPEDSRIQSRRVIFFHQDNQRWSSAETNAPSSFGQSAVALSDKSVGWLDQTSMSLPFDTLETLEKSVSKSLLDGYTGTRPLIGLSRITECQSEDGCTFFFLCHCCRKRNTKRGIIDHLTCSYHLKNYLMETRPEQVEETINGGDNHQLLRTLAHTVEQEEGRGELKVVKAPKSVCIFLTSKCYRLCMKWLCKGWTHNPIQKRKMAFKGPSVNKTSNADMPDKCADVMMSRKKMRKLNDTVFKVSLPLTKGSVLLERTSFSKARLPLSALYSPPPDSDPLSESQSEFGEVEFGAQSFGVNYTELPTVCTTSQIQQDPYGGDADSDQHVGPNVNFDSHYQEVDGCLSNDEYRQSEYITGTEDPKFDREDNHRRHDGSQKRSNMRYYKEIWQNENPQTQSGGGELSSAVPHTQERLSYHSFYGCVDSCTELRCSSALQNTIDTRLEVSREESPEMSSNVNQYYCQQQAQYQYMTQDHHASFVTSMGPHGSFGELSPQLNVPWISVPPHLGDAFAHSGNIGLQTELSSWNSYMGFTSGHIPTAPKSDMRPQQPIQVGDQVTSNPSYYNGPVTNPEQQFIYPSGVWTPR